MRWMQNIFVNFARSQHVYNARIQGGKGRGRFVWVPELDLGALRADAADFYVLGGVVRRRIRAAHVHRLPEHEKRVLALGRPVSDRVRNQGRARSARRLGNVHKRHARSAQIGLGGRAGAECRIRRRLGTERLPVRFITHNIISQWRSQDIF